jgi:pSer/pThr/pTyr-binding forkhead associated (FHA) protein
MTTQTIPKPTGPSTLAAEPDATQVLAPTAEATLDALPLLDPRARAKTILPQHALRGPHLALEDGGRMRLLRLDQDITHVGRGTGAHVRIDEHRVSRDHAILVRHGRFFRLLDNRSSNGTYVNGRRIVATNIASGDLIELGPVRLRFVEVA